jgi:hypothetical protein
LGVSFKNKKAGTTRIRDINDVTPGNPAILPAGAPETPESAFNLKTRGFPSPPHGGFGFGGYYMKITMIMVSRYVKITSIEKL